MFTFISKSLTSFEACNHWGSTVLVEITKKGQWGQNGEKWSKDHFTDNSSIRNEAR